MLIFFLKSSWAPGDANSIGKGKGQKQMITEKLMEQIKKGKKNDINRNTKL